MDIGKYGVTFFVVVAVVALLVASPVLSRVLVARPRALELTFGRAFS
jgi:hypothetical protein